MVFGKDIDDEMDCCMAKRKCVKGWSEYEVTGVWKNVRYGFGCYARDLDTNATVAVTGSRALSLRRGSVLYGKVCPCGNWHGTPMVKLDPVVPATTRNDVMEYLTSDFQLPEKIAKRVYAKLGGVDSARALVKAPARLKGVVSDDDEFRLLVDRVYVFRNDNPIRLAYPCLSELMSKRLLEHYLDSDRAIRELKTDPYAIISEVSSFRLMHAEMIHSSNGGDADDAIRVNGLLATALRAKLSRTGDTYINASDTGAFTDWVTAASQLSTGYDSKWFLTPEYLAAHVNGLVSGNYVDRFQMPSGEWVFADRVLNMAELGIANAIAYLSGCTSLCHISAHAVASEVCDFYGERFGVDAHIGVANVDPWQQLAITNALRRRISIVTGGPGRGKTTIAACICDIWRRYNGKPICLTSFTGKATSRLRDAVERETGRDDYVARTMSSLIMSAQCTHGSVNMDGWLIIIDEASMVDVRVMNKFMSLATDSQVVIIGDVDQLPSIGNGEALHDIIGSGAVEVTRLQTSYRAKGAATLLHNGDAIVDGHVDDIVYDDSFAWHNEGVCDVDAVVDEYMRLSDDGEHPERVCLLGAFKAPHDPLSVEKLNIAIRDKVNPNGLKTKLRYAGCELRVGDRVIITKNMHDIGVVNGDVGVLCGVKSNGRAIVDIDDGGEGYSVAIEPTDTGYIELAYALTIHKSQGSEYEHVIVVVSPRLTDSWAQTSFAVRNLMYTAVTRAKKDVSLFGSRVAFDRCLANPMRPRNTLLKDYLTESGAERGYL